MPRGYIYSCNGLDSAYYSGYLIDVVSDYNKANDIALKYRSMYNFDSIWITAQPADKFTNKTKWHLGET